MSHIQHTIEISLRRAMCEAQYKLMVSDRLIKLVVVGPLCPWTVHPMLERVEFALDLLKTIFSEEDWGGWLVVVVAHRRTIWIDGCRSRVLLAKAWRSLHPNCSVRESLQTFQSLPRMVHALELEEDPSPLKWHWEEAGATVRVEEMEEEVWGPLAPEHLPKWNDSPVPAVIPIQPLHPSYAHPNPLISPEEDDVDLQLP